MGVPVFAPGVLAEFLLLSGSACAESWLLLERGPVPVGVNKPSSPVGVGGQLEGLSGSSELVSE